MKLTRRLVAVLLSGMILGCSGGEPPKDVEPVEISIRDNVVNAIESLLDENVGGGSEMGAVMEDIGKLREIDPEVAKEVEDVFMAAMGGTAPDKAKLQELLEKVKNLPVGGAQ
jgi:hypothetical protein